jgi:acyl-coenzyme A synthetase/AMP-(fatty) acid ligase
MVHGRTAAWPQRKVIGMSAVIEDSPPSPRTLPLTAGAGSRAIVFDADGPVSLDRFLAQARALAALLPDGRHAINLCEDRYRFLLAFCAVALRGQVTLLPASRAPGTIAEEAARHADSYCLGDIRFAATAQPPRYWCLPEPLPEAEAEGAPPCVDPDALAAIGFTSGSTGEPGASPKRWDSFHASTCQNFAALRDLWPDGVPAHIVATVPPQHMYGMELTVLLPLFADVAVHAGRPFFPQDILQALREVPSPRLLVTTPVHLRALLEACAADPSIVPPPLAGIVSATAPMPAELAAAAEARFDCELREFFGSTETCVIASRRSAREHAWTPFPGVQLQPQPDGCLVRAPHLPTPVALADLVEVRDDGCFLLRGRNADLLEIAGKRASLGDLTCKLQSVPGVIDGVVFQLDATAGANGIRRIAALVVAPGLDETAILDALRRSIDPVFLPRPLRCVPALPRNATGKLPRAALLALLHCANR